MGTLDPGGDFAGVIEQLRVAKVEIENTVKDRALHDSLDDVTDTLERWSIEQLLQREYHGRFLFELVQNAVDAFHRRYPDRDDGLLSISLDGARLVVANEGEYLTPDVVVHSLSKVGQSTKPEGTSIGHKGIGFKSALEISLNPRIYSRHDSNKDFTLRVRYDPAKALKRVREGTVDPGWDELVAQAGRRLGVERNPEQVPVLRFPIWDDTVPEWISNAASYRGRAFNTVLALEHRPQYDERLGLSEAVWSEKIRLAADDISDEVVLLLGSLGTIIVEGIYDSGPLMIERELVRSSRDAAGGLRVSEVVLRRNGVESSRWLRFERSLDGEAPSSELVVAARVERRGDQTLHLVAPGQSAVAALESRTPLRPADCFHLYFPTKIPTGLPFLLHAYFKVDAGRTQFASDSVAENRALLRGLRGLVAYAVRWVAKDLGEWNVDAADLPNLFAAAAAGAENVAVGGLVGEFRDELLADLDEVPWVPGVGPAGSTIRVTPRDVLVDGRGSLDQLLREAFEHSYPARLGIGNLPDQAVGPAAIQFLSQRRRHLMGDLATAFWADLLRPGPIEPWVPSPEHMDRGFVALIGLLEHWLAIDRSGASKVLASLAGDERAALIPVLAPSGDRSRRYPAKVEPGPEASSGLVLARVAGSLQPMPPPPVGLRVAFVRDELLTSDLIGLAAEFLGIRRFDTDAVLDAVVASLKSREVRDDPLAMTRFTWRLLEESESTFGVPGAVEQLQAFAPGMWAWFRPGAVRTDDELRRARGLAGLPLPLQSGGDPRPAGELVFGRAWADWLASTGPRPGSAAAERAAAYRDLELARPERELILAQPKVVAEALLGADATDSDLERIHAFLLRIGVWEVPPVDAFVDRTNRAVELRVPWSQLPRRDEHLARVIGADPDFAARQHHAIHVERDYRLVWMPNSSPPFLRALARGIDLYEACSQARVFCSGCARHGRMPANDSTEAWSYLAFALRSEAWLSASFEGQEQTEMVAPAESWFEPNAPSMPGLLQSPYRFLVRGPENMDPQLAAFLGMESLESASPARIGRLLVNLREEYEPRAETGEIRGGTELGRTLVGVHRLCYQRLHRVDPDGAAAIATKVHVLSMSGPRMRWVPPTEARHDDGRHPVFKGLFSRGEVWFVVLKQDQTAIRGSLGVPPFEVKIHQHTEGEVRQVTDEVRPFVHDLAVEFLALLVFHSIGGPTLELDSEEFRLRARRLEALEVRHVSSLSLDVEVVGIGTVTRVGDRSNQDVYVAEPTSAHPVLFHDLADEDWQTRLRMVIGPHVANVLASDAYAATFQLLLLQDDGQRARFLLDLGIGDEELDQVRSAMGRASSRAKAESSRWRAAVTAVLGLSSAAAKSDQRWRRALSAKLGDDADVLLQAGEGADIRADERPDGPLAVLVRAGIDLATLDAELLRSDPEDGLRIDAAGHRLVEWRRLHAQEVVAVLARSGRYDGESTGRPATWRPATYLRFDLEPAAADWLAPVLVDLRAAGLEPDASLMADPLECSRHLAALVGLDPGNLSRFYESLHDKEGWRRLGADFVAQWRRTLHEPLVALRAGQSDPGFLIRELGADVSAELAALPPDQAAFADQLGPLVGSHPGAAIQLAALVRESDPLRPPPDPEVRRLVVEIVGADHLDRVRAALRGTTAEEVATVRRAIRELRAQGVQPLAVSGLKRAAPRPDLNRADDQPKRQISQRPRRHDQGAKDKAGRDAELLVVASVIDHLLGLDEPELDRAVKAMLEVLQRVFEGQGIKELEAAAAAVTLPAVEGDARIAAMRSFIHVSQRSDQFGFDVLGWLPGWSGEGGSAPVLLEVKSVGQAGSERRRFKATANEWSVAEDPRAAANYCFCLVGRDKNGIATIELLPNPSAIARPDELSLNTDTWAVSYAVDTKA